MDMPKKLSRRSMLQLGVAGGVGALGGTLIAATPGDPKCATPPQIEGPFYPKRAQLDTDTDLTVIQGRADRAEGDVITIRGHVLDDLLHPIDGALVEIWQANAHGRYHHDDDPNPAPEDPAFQGWGRSRRAVSNSWPRCSVLMAGGSPMRNTATRALMSTFDRQMVRADGAWCPQRGATNRVGPGAGVK
jgi:protocatechuate 3,4-dioxygenase, beta subunit